MIVFASTKCTGCWREAPRQRSRPPACEGAQLEAPPKGNTFFFDLISIQNMSAKLRERDGENEYMISDKNNTKANITWVHVWVTGKKYLLITLVAPEAVPG